MRRRQQRVFVLDGMRLEDAIGCRVPFDTGPIEGTSTLVDNMPVAELTATLLATDIENASRQHLLHRP